MASSTTPPSERSQKLLKFSVRDLLWLLLVVGLGLGWWLDQDRIRREREALRLDQARIRREQESLRLAVERLQALPLRVAEKRLAVIEAELTSLMEIKRRNPGALTDSEVRRVELGVQLARLEVEKARVSEEHGAASKPVKLPNSK